jgi:hypothetical protein
MRWGKFDLGEVDQVLLSDWHTVDRINDLSSFRWLTGDRGPEWEFQETLTGVTYVVRGKALLEGIRTRVVEPSKNS